MEKQRIKTPRPVQKPALMWRNILFYDQLSRQFFEQLPAGTVFLNLVVVFIDVVAHRQKENLGQNLLVAAKQELPETIILLDDPESTLGLDGAVHPQQDTFFTGDVIQRLFTLFDELFRYLKGPVAF